MSPMALDSLDYLPLRQQLAQRFIIGYSGLSPDSLENTVFQRFLSEGLGGVIFFRENFQENTQLLSPEAILRMLHRMESTRPAGVPSLFLSIDQEGGQVERLPFSIFPSTLTPRAIAMNQTASPLAFAERVYEAMASHLALLGFNLNYFPTLDVNLNPQNPIIGVRSFGDDPETVWKFAQIALAAHQRHGVLTVGKHFPGHGNGTVDSHISLPRLLFTEAELQPFQKAIDAGLPTMMVSHGYYPDLQDAVGEQQVPASASKTVIGKLLRERCGFQGLVMTDDMEMGAITQNQTPVEAALASLNAGAEILIYRQSREIEWEIFEAMVAAAESGNLDMALHHQALAHIAEAKAEMNRPNLDNLAEVSQRFQPDTVSALSEELCRAGVAVLSETQSLVPLVLETSYWLFHPDRQDIVNYAFDQPLSLELPELLGATGHPPAQEVAYRLKESIPLPDNATRAPEVIVFVAWNAVKHPAQAEAFRQLQDAYPEAALVLVSAGTPYDHQYLPGAHLHLGLCNYRPATMKALVNVLTERSLVSNRPERRTS